MNETQQPSNDVSEQTLQQINTTDLNQIVTVTPPTVTNTSFANPSPIIKKSKKKLLTIVAIVIIALIVAGIAVWFLVLNNKDNSFGLNDSQNTSSSIPTPTIKDAGSSAPAATTLNKILYLKSGDIIASDSSGKDTLINIASDISSFSVSRSKKYIAFIDKNSQLYTATIDGKDIRTVDAINSMDITTELYINSWLNDDRFIVRVGYKDKLASGAYFGFYFVSADGKITSFSNIPSLDMDYSFTFSADLTNVAYRAKSDSQEVSSCLKDRPMTIRVMNLASLAKKTVFDASSIFNGCGSGAIGGMSWKDIIWSPDNKDLVFNLDNYEKYDTVYLSDVSNKVTKLTDIPSDFYINKISWPSDNKIFILAEVGAPRKVSVFTINKDGTGYKESKIAFGGDEGSYQIPAFCISPDLQKALFISSYYDSSKPKPGHSIPNDNAYKIQTLDLKTGTQTTVVSDIDNSSSLAWL